MPAAHLFVALQHWYYKGTGEAVVCHLWHLSGSIYLPIISWQSIGPQASILSLHSGCERLLYMRINTSPLMGFLHDNEERCCTTVPDFHVGIVCPLPKDAGADQSHQRPFVVLIGCISSVSSFWDACPCQTVGLDISGNLKHGSVWWWQYGGIIDQESWVVSPQKSNCFLFQICWNLLFFSWGFLHLLHPILNWKIVARSLVGK